MPTNLYRYLRYSLLPTASERRRSADCAAIPCRRQQLRGISRISGLAYDTVVSIVQAASEKAQMIHNVEVEDIDTDAITADELWSFIEKNKSAVSAMNSKPEIAGLR